VGGEPLIGKADPDGRRSVFRVNLEPHCLVRLQSRPKNLFWFHHHKPAKQCSSFQAESFRLSLGAGEGVIALHSFPGSGTIRPAVVRSAKMSSKN
jgi:hypothetical protein